MEAAITLPEPVGKQRPTSLRASETRRRVTIDAAWVFVHGGYCIPQGRSECVMYLSDVALLRERICDPIDVGPNHWRTDMAKIDEAKRIHEERRRSFVAAARGTADAQGIPLERLMGDYEGTISWQQEYVQRHYHFADNAGYKTVHPIRELIIHDEEIAPPVDEQQAIIGAQMRTMFREMIREFASTRAEETTSAKRK